MRIGGLVGRTLRAVPAGMTPALGAAARAGFVRPTSGGLILLPLGVWVIDRIAAELVSGLACEPIKAPTWSRDVARAMADLLRLEVQSYRQLPLRIATRGCAQLPQNEYAGWEGAEVLTVAGAFGTEVERGAFFAQIDDRANRLGDAGRLRLAHATGAGNSRALLALRDDGRRVTLACPQCGTRMLREAAPFSRGDAPPCEARGLELIRTPGATTIQALAEMLHIGREQTLKALFLTNQAGELILVVVRGDLEVGVDKLSAVLGASRLRPATEAEIRSSGAVPGYASPIGLRVRQPGTDDGVIVVLDLSVYSSASFVAGANRPDYHYAGLDPRRDLTATHVADVALAPAGARCADCELALTEARGTIVALGSDIPAPTYRDETGVDQQACASLVSLDLLAFFEEIIAVSADGTGIAWPAGVAPADVHVVDLKAGEACAQSVAALEREGLRVLLDDRTLGAGVKFTDADLIGCPLRVTVSPRSLQAGGAELALRCGLSSEVVPLDTLATLARARLATLMSR
jgi:prolyl-tRNA synthetase